MQIECESIIIKNSEINKPYGISWFKFLSLVLSKFDLISMNICLIRSEDYSISSCLSFYVEQKILEFFFTLVENERILEKLKMEFFHFFNTESLKEIYYSIDFDKKGFIDFSKYDLKK